MIDPVTLSPPDRAGTSWMRKARERYPRAWAPWTPEEDDLLRHLVARGASPAEQQSALGRGPGGVGSRRVALGLQAGEELLSRPRARSRAANLPVPMMDWVPEWRDHLPEVKWVTETARLWGVDVQVLQSAMDELDLDAWTVFVLRYGLAGRCAYTPRAVAELLVLSVRAVSRLQDEAERAIWEGLVRQGPEPRVWGLEPTLARRRPRARPLPPEPPGA